MRIHLNKYPYILSSLMLAGLGSAGATVQIQVWIAEEFEGKLWGISNYDTDAKNNTYDFGQFKTQDGAGNWNALPVNGGERNIEAMAVNQATGEAYFSINQTIVGPSGNFTTPVLARFNLNNAVFGGEVRLTIVNTFQNSLGVTSPREIEGLAYNPIDGQLYGVAGEPGGAVDNLYRIDPATGIYTDLGPATGTVNGIAESLTYFDGLEFIGNTLYGLDNDDFKLYTLNYSGSGSIISGIVHNNIENISGHSAGAGNLQTNVESLFYDNINNRLVGIDSDDSFSSNQGQQELYVYDLSGTNGANGNLGSYMNGPSLATGASNMPANADPEGSAFYPITITIPEPTAVALAALGALTGLRRRRRSMS
jgi:hypothetical protein